MESTVPFGRLWTLENALPAALVGLVVLLAALFGILTRPVGYLASFWLANAVLLGLMVRKPTLAGPSSWVAAFAAFVAADVLTGNGLGVSVWLTSANVAGALTGHLLFRLLPEEYRLLKRPHSVLFLFAICLCASLMAAVVGGGVARILFNRPLVHGIGFWFVTEMVNYLVILPPILAFPKSGVARAEVSAFFGNAGQWRVTRRAVWQVAPVAALVVSGVAGVIVGGPGALMFTSPALLWCALTFGVFTTSLITLMCCAWLLVATAAGLITISGNSDVFDGTASIRLGVALLALGPLIVATISAARRELLERLTYAATYDNLTGTLSRGTFMSKAMARLQRVRVPRFAVLLLDIDNFKRINDTHGHATGDAVLVEFARRINGLLEKDDLYGRIGGEEFAIFLNENPPGRAAETAELIRSTVQDTAMSAVDGGELSVTVSLGVACENENRRGDLDRLLSDADTALYEAKARGRNRVIVSAG